MRATRKESISKLRLPVRVGISRCLLGDAVRYDGGHKRDSFLVDVLGSVVDWVPVCPEVEAGMTTPREAIRLVGDARKPHLVTVKSGQDLTTMMSSFSTRPCCRVGGQRTVRLCLQKRLAKLRDGKSPCSQSSKACLPGMESGYSQKCSWSSFP